MGMRRGKRAASLAYGSANLAKRILIVDDDRSMTSLLKTLLELDNFEVVTVARAGDAIAKADAFQPDAFLIDHHLHDMDGAELVTQLRALPHYAATFIVIASGMDKEVEALAAGANRFLLKPYDPDTLSKLLKESL